jgi:hypothetical protein
MVPLLLLLLLLVELVVVELLVVLLAAVGNCTRLLDAQALLAGQVRPGLGVGGQGMGVLGVVWV